MPPVIPEDRIVRLPLARGYERGLHHGRALSEEIAAIAAIRSGLCLSQGMFRSDAELLEIAALHLPVLEAFDRELFDELRGIADGAGLPLARIVVLNHYTDLKDLDPRVILGPQGAEPRAPQRDLEKEEDCTAIVAATAEGGVLAQTWDMHGSAAPFVIALHLPAVGEGPEAWMLSIAGCLGMAGMNRHGVGITINNLKSDDARVGLVWPALVRRVLTTKSAEAARNEVIRAPLGSGHHYLVADAARAFGIETSGTLSEVWAQADLRAPGSGFHHENHCRGTRVSAVSSISPISTTLLRHAFMEKQPAPTSSSEIWARLGSHEGYPKSVCTHLSSPEAPHAMLTCAGLLMELEQKQIAWRPGCLNEKPPLPLAWD
jgi:isopenicillin-N N-acyltransferase like protein